MAQVDELLRRRLKREAEQWIEQELEARMAAAEEEINLQADIGSNLHCTGTVNKHIEDATAYARQEILRELEVQAEDWIREELKKRSK
jgi:hypothetical protein